ncbi:hypothetical protein PQU94_16205 [Asticcacaulis sp. DXS10W]|uniref:DUF2171 domain-containing protein n=1 Tax=Asticcacaulis currens TaxID=2984210 RepID=A0ABT5II11_9CAUL|nr:hypothetical protein [Asticcacaulis currens]MDC7695821.1 hypothetical protein [Asticcacaulis currens]
MTDDIPPHSFEDGERVEHAEKGLGTVSHDPADDNLIVPHGEARKVGDDMVHVVWDDDRFPVGKVAASELQKVPEATAAISTGM